MYLKSHDGFCCGMSVIFRFPEKPTRLLESTGPYNSETLAQLTRQYPGYIWVNRPSETAEERLRGLISYRETRRESGIIEIVLTLDQVKEWASTLKEFGFKEAARNRNSNTNSTIVVFFRLSGHKNTPTLEKKG